MKLSAVLATFSALFLMSCADDEKEKPIPVDKTGETIPSKLVGRIASVPSDKRFVLIQSFGKWEIPAGTILTTRGLEDRTANLLVTGENMGQYAAADLQAGSVGVGDAVYSRQIPKRTTPTAPPAPIDTHATRPF